MKRVTVYLTETEYETVRRKAFETGTKMTEIFRDAVFSQKSPFAHLPAQDREIMERKLSQR